MSIAKKDLLVLVADLDAEETIKTLLSQPQKLGIKPIEYKMLRHPQRDSGCYTDAHNLLRSQYHLYHKAIVVFDYHGSGEDTKQNQKALMKFRNILRLNLSQMVGRPIAFVSLYLTQNLKFGFGATRRKLMKFWVGRRKALLYENG
jgi:hypothetical protein